LINPWIQSFSLLINNWKPIQ